MPLLVKTIAIKRSVSFRTIDSSSCPLRFSAPSAVEMFLTAEDAEKRRGYSEIIYHSFDSIPEVQDFEVNQKPHLLAA